MTPALDASRKARNTPGRQIHRKCVPQIAHKELNLCGWAIISLKAVLMCWVLLACLGCNSNSSSTMVNSLEDIEQPTAGAMTLRAAIAQAPADERITFAPSLNGGTIELSIVGSSHSILMGEVYSGMQFQGYQERDYGKSALYARKNVIIDASSLPDGITLKWTGGDSNRARVLAVYGNLTMNNVTIISGYASAEAISTGTQPYTLGRGGGLAVWGIATLDHCTIAGNRAAGDEESSRDRGTYGGGIYANGLIMQDCVVSGNRAIGYGAAGGGIYSVGGADGSQGNDATLTRCIISGNRVTAQHAYGGGIFTLGGGPNNSATMRLTNCTIARNLAEDHPLLAQIGQYYYRGGGIYLGGGYLTIESCTIAENQVNGILAIFSNKPNMGGGGVAATVGNAHVVENMKVWHSIIVGNTLNASPNDLFTGSLLHFYSYGYNLIGALDFSQILVPVPAWSDLSRKHWPKEGDMDGVALGAALNVSGAHYHASVLSAGTDAGGPAILWYPPAGIAVDQIPIQGYSVSSVLAGYVGYGVSTDDFLNYVLEKLRTDPYYSSILGSDFGTSFGDMTGVTWYGPAATWPSDPLNAAWIKFWRDLDVAIGGRLGAVALGDDFWVTFPSGSLGSNVTISVTTESQSVTLTSSDQLGNPRPGGTKGDIGAIEE